jgi:hypothetical protein
MPSMKKRKIAIAFAVQATVISSVLLVVVYIRGENETGGRLGVAAYYR